MADFPVDNNHRLAVLHVLSKHFGHEKYNEQNPGIGLRLGRGDWFGQGGVYRNSLDRNSAYLGVGKTITELGPAKLNLTGGLATGYDVPVVPYVSPELVFNLGRAQAVLNYLPKVNVDGKKAEHTLGLSVGVPF